MRSPPAAIPVTLLLGRPQVDKAALLQLLLQEMETAQTVVLTLADEGPGAMPRLASDAGGTPAAGCLCCADRGQLATSLETLLRDMDNGRRPMVRRLVIDADAEADPLAMVETLRRHPYLALRYRVAAVVAVVDSAASLQALEPPTPRRQLAMADVVVLTGSARQPPVDRARFVQAMRHVNPAARIVDGEAVTAAPGALAAALAEAAARSR